MKRVLIRIAAIAAAIATMTAAFAGQTLLERTAELVTSPNVALDLKLSSTQAAQRDKLVDAYSASNLAAQQRAENSSAEQMQAEMEKLRADLDSKLLALLNPVQVNRLKQLGVQREGTAAMQDDVIARDLKLTAAQRTKINSIIAGVEKARDAYDTAVGAALDKIPDPGNDDAALRAYAAKQQAVLQSLKPQERQYLAVKVSGDKQILAVLTPGQRNAWTAMHGKPLKDG